jgi:hypothetical protein
MKVDLIGFVRERKSLLVAEIALFVGNFVGPRTEVHAALSCCRFDRRYRPDSDEENDNTARD